jgi:type IV secretory pathway VirB10-like protein
MDPQTRSFARRARRKSLARPRVSASSRSARKPGSLQRCCSPDSSADRLRHIDGGTPTRFESQLRSKPDESLRAADAVVERIPDAQPSVRCGFPRFRSPHRFRRCFKQAENSVHVPALAPISATQMQAAQLAHEREERRRALLDAAQAAPVMVRLNETERRSLPVRRSRRPVLPSPTAASGAGNASQPRARKSRRARCLSDLCRQALRAIESSQRAKTIRRPTSCTPVASFRPSLLTGINADLPGTIVAQVRNDVFDSVTGRYLLIPRGTRLVGTYDNRIVQGQRRVLVAWTRLLYPDGSSVDLLGMPGTDEAGYAGFGANVDEHLNKVFTPRCCSASSAPARN